MLSVAKVEWWGIVVCGCRDLVSVSANEGQVDGHVADEGGAFCPIAQVEMLGIILNAFSKQKQRPVEALEGLNSVLLEQAHEVIGLLDCSLKDLVALNRRYERHADPESGDHGEGKQ